MAVNSLSDSSGSLQNSDNLRNGDRPFAGEGDFYPEAAFDRMLYLERKRTERSRRPFLLMLLNIEGLSSSPENSNPAKEIGAALSSCIRETDIKGWFERGKIIGIIFTEINSIDEIVKEKIFLKIQDCLCAAIGGEQVEKIKVSYHVFPEGNSEPGKDRRWFNCSFYPEITKKPPGKKLPLYLKRAIDLVGGLFGLVLLSPALLVISLGVKLTSRGPVLFKQERVGQWGQTFTFLKFRSMYVNSDESSHKEYVTRLITQENGTPSCGDPPKGQVIYKMTNDRRITALGNFLRKTSLDELPQFVNVLKGEMSLVGPRPPIPYECEVYDLWHRRRVLEMKPGITGLWQVVGRSRRTFDEMVRLDLKYINEWSLWLDFKIILKTPWVMVSGNGGF
jgi:lipopolysaccharide/colanic/teichoic acid biosynthesis glycosyltransferase